MRRVTPSYFATMGLQTLRGRVLSDADTTTSAPVVLINQTTAEAVLPRPRSHRRPDAILGRFTHDRGRGHQRTLPGAHRGGADCGLHTALAGTIGDRRAAAQDEDGPDDAGSVRASG